MTKTRVKACGKCGAEFSYEVRRGCERRRACSEECRKALKVKRLAVYKRAAARITCRTDDCSRPVSRPRTGLCEACYYRIRRHGDSSYHTRVAKPQRMHSHGYVQMYQPKHPLAKNGSVGEHRLVLYDAIGGGAHPCHWCGRSMIWNGDRHSRIVVDHLNDVKTDNTIQNLVPSCNDCNRARGAMLPFLSRLRPEVVEQFIGLVRTKTMRESVRK